MIIRLIFGKISLILVFGFLSLQMHGQLPYTQNLFEYDSLLNVVYGVATDHAGNTDTLKMDIYRPLGDNNCKRPVIVFVHGGAWIAGSKEDYNMAYMSREMAKKGWVVANINYRLGTHKAASYVMYALCNTSLSQPCGYISDSAEIYRANFRGMQDAKGAIRFLKSRYAMDSSDIQNVYIAGESAGGFVALAAAFTDRLSEKHASCSAIASAPTPDADMNGYGCIPSPNDLRRPDLGDIEGSLNLGSYDASVRGVGSFYGGVLDTNLFVQNDSVPLVYLFHQGSDVVVSYDYGPLLGRTSWECYAQTNICQTYYFYPPAFGGEGIRKYFTRHSSTAPIYQADIISNFNYLNNCFSNGHSIDNINLRLQNMTDLFASRIAASGNDPRFNCLGTGIAEMDSTDPFLIYPNPASEELHIYSKVYLEGLQYRIFDLTGRVLLHGNLIQNTSRIDIHLLEEGFYLLKIGDSYSQGLRVFRH